MDADIRIDNSGVAAIKKEFIIPFTKEDTQSSDHPAEDTGSSEPPAKRRRGQNKHRPRPVRVDFSKMLCPSLHNVRDNEDHAPCLYGDKCRYTHSMEEFMAGKPPDIADSCHVFDTFGECLYGAACRYAFTHLTGKFHNVSKLKQENSSRRLEDTVCNTLSKDLRFSLRKRKVKFERTAAFLKRAGLDKDSQGDKGEAAVDVSAPLNGVGKGLSDEVVEPGKVLTDEVDEAPGKSSEEVTASNLSDVTIGKGTSDELVSKVEHISQEMMGVDTISGEGPNDCRGSLTDEGVVKLRPMEKKKVDFNGKLYLAPLTTTGNLPFRRVCKEFGADITCGEMAMSTNLLQGHLGEWALLKRHESEDVFGVQVCGCHVDSMTRCAELINSHTHVDFVDINVGCPIDLVFKKGSGSALMGRQTRFEGIVRGMVDVLDCPLTVKMRAGIYKKNWNAHKLIPKLRNCGVSLVTVHGRSREQRYTKQADWEYIQSCVQAGSPMPVFGNGDVLSYEDHNSFLERSGATGLMIARGALIKPWLFTEIKEQRHWDISSSERLDMIHRYANYGLEHWGSDTQGVENTRRFLLEWLSFLYRYIPVGLLERVPQRINQRPPHFHGRDDLETLMASNNCQDWVKIAEMVLGRAPGGFSFLPKHKANAYT